RCQLNLAVTRFAALQFSEVLRLDCESAQIRELRWIAELLNCEIAGEFAQRIEIIRELEITLRCGVNVDRAEHKDLVWGRRLKDDCHGFPTVNGIDLLSIQAYAFLQELVQQKDLLTCSRPREQQQEHCNRRIQCTFHIAPLT